MNTLYIDTASNKQIIVRLTINEKILEEKKEIQNNRTQIVLSLIQQLLANNGLLPQNLDAIEVNAGPGSFTGVRVGVAIANALAFGLQIPVNGIIFTENRKLVEPLYSQ